MAPTSLIVVLFLAAFLLSLWQYFRIDPRRRVLNLRFGMMVGALVAAVTYPIFVLYHPTDRPASWLFLLMGLCLLGTAYFMLRHMPPRENY